MITAIVIAAVAGAISLIAAGTSIGTILHFKKKFASLNEETTKVDVENEKTEKKYTVPNSGFTENENEMIELDVVPKTLLNTHASENNSKLQLLPSNKFHFSTPIMSDKDTNLHLNEKPYSISLPQKPHRDNSSMVTETTTKQKIHIETHDKHDYYMSESKTRTGMPNEVANNLSKGANHILTAFTPPSELQTIVGGIGDGLKTIVNGVKDENISEKNPVYKLTVPKNHTRHSSVDLQSFKEEKPQKLFKTPEPKRITLIDDEEDLLSSKLKNETKKQKETKKLTQLNPMDEEIIEDTFTKTISNSGDLEIQPLGMSGSNNSLEDLLSEQM